METGTPAGQAGSGRQDLQLICFSQEPSPGHHAGVFLCRSGLILLTCFFAKTGLGLSPLKQLDELVGVALSAKSRLVQRSECTAWPPNQEAGRCARHHNVMLFTARRMFQMSEEEGISGTLPSSAGCSGAQKSIADRGGWMHRLVLQLWLFVKTALPEWWAACRLNTIWVYFFVEFLCEGVLQCRCLCRCICIPL